MRRVDEKLWRYPSQTVNICRSARGTLCSMQGNASRFESDLIGSSTSYFFGSGINEYEAERVYYYSMERSSIY
jgi:hypothetical protein